MTLAWIKSAFSFPTPIKVFVDGENVNPGIGKGAPMRSHTSKMVIFCSACSSSAADPACQRLTNGERVLCAESRPRSAPPAGPQRQPTHTHHLSSPRCRMTRDAPLTSAPPLHSRPHSDATSPRLSNLPIQAKLCIYKCAS